MAFAEPDRPTLEPVTDHVSVGQDRLGASLRNATRLRALTGSYLAELQGLENVLGQLCSETVETAVGQGLDWIGAIVRQPRTAELLADAAYRTVLRATFAALRSNGTGEDLIRVLTLLLAGVSAFTLTEYAQYTVLLEPFVETPYAELMARVLQKARAGACQLWLVAVPFSVPNPQGKDWFAFAHEGIFAVNDPPQGFVGVDVTFVGDVVDVVYSSGGGHMVGILQA